MTVHSKDNGVSAPRKVQFRSKSEFSKTLKKRVDQYFRTQDISRYGGIKLYFKSLVMFVSLSSAWSVLMFGDPSVSISLICAVVIGLSVSGVGFNIMHDGGHRSFSKKQWINRWMAYSSDLIGTSSYNWNVKHNQLHHTYVNINGYDNDLNVGALARFAPAQPRYFFHRFQHFYMWFLYCFIKVKWSFFDDYETLIKGKMGNHPMKRPAKNTLFWLFFGKAFFYTWALCIPLLYHSDKIGSVLLIYALASAVSGFTLAIVFSLAHMSAEIEFPEPHPTTFQMEDDWMVHQLRTTVNFARENKILSWYVGGLNFQIEHHLFPKISHVHYPALSKIVETVCSDYKIPYLSHSTMRKGVYSHFYILRKLGTSDSL